MSDEAFKYCLKILKEEIVDIENKEADELAKELYDLFSKKLYTGGGRMDITSIFLEKAVFLKPSAKQAIENFKGKITIRKVSKKFAVASVSTYALKGDNKIDKYLMPIVNNIALEMDFERAKKEKDVLEVIKHEISHIVIEIQKIYKRKNLKSKMVRGISHSSTPYNYLTNDEEFDQVISKFIARYRKNKFDKKISYENFLRLLYKEFKFEESVWLGNDIINKMLNDKKLKDRIYRRFWREGINLTGIMKE